MVWHEFFFVCINLSSCQQKQFLFDLLSCETGWLGGFSPLIICILQHIKLQNLKNTLISGRFWCFVVLFGCSPQTNNTNPNPCHLTVNNNLHFVDRKVVRVRVSRGGLALVAKWRSPPRSHYNSKSFQSYCTHLRPGHALRAISEP